LQQLENRTPRARTGHAIEQAKEFEEVIGTLHKKITVNGNSLHIRLAKYDDLEIEFNSVKECDKFKRTLTAFIGTTVGILFVDSVPIRVRSILPTESEERF
jgi:hypothetical protein